MLFVKFFRIRATKIMHFKRKITRYLCKSDAIYYACIYFLRFYYLYSNNYHIVYFCLFVNIDRPFLLLYFI